jgi:hypothetical protein
MNSEIKVCQNCKGEFTIEPDDFSFYEKIKVPPPTFCPECRLIRRSIWRNHRSLYKRNCFLCNKFLITMYSDSAPVLCNECFYGDKFDSFAYGQDYDFSKPFFEQLKNLIGVVPRLYTLRAGNLINSDYTNFTKDNKNVYLSYSVSGCEDSMYCENSDFVKNSLDIYSSKKLDNCYYNIGSDGNYNTLFAIQSMNCLDSAFIYDCVNCSNCFLSFNLRNKKYFFKNQQLSKEEYERKIESLKLEKFSNFEKIKKEFDELLKSKAIHRYASVYHSENVEGDYISNSKNIKYSFNCYDSENISFANRSLGAKDCYDNQGIGFGSELVYESVASTLNDFKDSFVYLCINNCRECEYSLILKNCKNCFGCVGLTNASFCIFNKQYSPDEYFIMVNKIKKQMNERPYSDKGGRIYKYGEFFPFDLSPFSYNETHALEFFPINKEEAEKRGYSWKDREKRDYPITLQTNNIPEGILEIDDSILKETIECQNKGDEKYQCTSAFKIMPEELKFYRQKGLPLPRICPNCRHFEMLKYYNPMKLWHRKCMKEGCPNEFETSYTPERPEIVYCESCYQKEVY